MKQGGTFSITIPCKITYEWWPEDKATEFEPCAAEEFILHKAILGNISVEDYFHHSDAMADLEEAVYDYLKENKDE